MNSDFKADVRSLSFSVDLTRDGTITPEADVPRQDFSLQNTSTLPINDARAFLATMKLLTASNPAVGLWSPPKDKLRVLRTLALVQVQAHQKIQPYQKLHYGSNVPFRHGLSDTVKYSATPFPGNPARPLQKSNPNALQDELLRHLKEDGKMSSFDFGVQFLDAGKMTYWGKHYDANFWIENASIKWNEAEASVHSVARLTLLANSQLLRSAGDAIYLTSPGTPALIACRSAVSIAPGRWARLPAGKRAHRRPLKSKNTSMLAGDCNREGASALLPAATCGPLDRTQQTVIFDNTTATPIPRGSEWS